MLIDCNIGGSIDGTAGADFGTLERQVETAEELGFDCVWTTEVGRDPFLPLMVAARTSPTLTVGTAVAVAFARNPMTVAVAANDLQAFSSGRFVLGLGSQIKAHVTRRYGMPWSEPAERMREFIQAVRAIWSCWDDGTRLAFDGKFYQHTLMTPMFTPERHAWGTPQIVLAAVGPRMTRVAAEEGDGLLLHSFTTARFLREVTMPLVGEGLAVSGRGRDAFTVCLPGLVATGGNDAELDAAVRSVRSQVAFYGATPAYRGVLDLHGLGDLHTELHRLSTAGDWKTMTSLIDDEVLEVFAVVGSPAAAATEILARYGELIDRFTLATPYPLSEEARGTLVQELRSPQPGVAGR